MILKLADFLLFQVAWFACVLGAARGQEAPGVLIAIACLAAHVLIHEHRGREVLLLITVGVAGTAIDGLLKLGGLTFYTSDIPWWPAAFAPLWITVVWIAFASLLRHSLAWLIHRPVLAAILGAAGGPLSFASGARMDAVGLHSNAWITLAALGIIYAVLTPLLVRLPHWRPFRAAPPTEGSEPGLFQQSSRRQRRLVR